MRFQPGEGPSRGLPRDCTTGCGTDGSIYSTSPDAVVVALARQNLTASVVVALHTASGASEVLNTISGGSKNIHSRNDILQ